MNNLIGVGDAIKAAIAIVRKNLVWFVVLGATPQIVTSLISQVFFGGLDKQILSPTNPYQFINFTQLFSGVIVLFFVSFILGTAFAIMQILLVIKTDKGEAVNFSDLLSASLKLFFSYLILGAFVGITVLVGIVLLVVPGIVFATWFFASFFILAQEGKRGMEAMKASKALVQGHTMDVLTRFFLGILVYALVSIVVGLILLPLEAIYLVGSVVSALISAVLGAVSLSFSYVIYRSLVEIKSAANPPAVSQPAPVAP
ncbi:MAG: hypothetical protein A3F35_00750 [Candidatus Woykebacteria bacterium RIFCSPHIGHO2_12_FULL_45_10]|uniref:Glycerophosphoryl diester phosphodiesterase membrane domain-containing protein n=1 Tax=Candidatus Woykebacteria bacterium RIFCSPHIGHO2_12_FULL_45_10 TaxID=1802603 RepID=A0A1G1WRH1_9BACT|nr:MAG: hypothetical protein A3F35_00750 [Candidatus Woykebacteria bacterium RIFCSPHIGHO2_12_FULL_45_10]